MSDSTRVVHDTIFVQGENPIELINKVDQFYRSGWENLMKICYFVIGIGAIVVPIALEWLKRQQYKADKTKLEAYINSILTEKEKDLSDRMEVKLESKLEDTVRVVNREILSLKSVSNAMRAESAVIEKYYGFALIKYLASVQDALLSEGHVNVHDMFDSIQTKCIPRLTLADVKNNETALGITVDSMLDDLLRLDKTHSYFQDIQKLRLALMGLR